MLESFKTGSCCYLSRLWSPHTRSASTTKRVRLKWVNSRGLDHIIERDTEIKAAVLLKDAISRSPNSFLPARSLSPLQRQLGLTVPVLRFLRRYPTLFSESQHPRFPSMPTFSLAPAADVLNSREYLIYESDSTAAAARLARLLMMTRTRSLPVSTLLSLRYDLGFPVNFASSLPAAQPDLLRYSPRPVPSICLVDWPSELAITSLQLRHLNNTSLPAYHDLKKGAMSSAAPLAFPMRFPRGYGGMNKVKAWMEEFHRLPYISPYEDASGIDPDSELAEKRAVGVLHEILSLTIHGKTHRNYLRGLRDEVGLPHKFTRLFTRYPGIFYLSLKCKTTTVVLREGYEKGKLVDPHPLARLREKYHYVMRTGILYRGMGMTKLVLDDDDSAIGALAVKEEVEEEEDGDAELSEDDDVESYDNGRRDFGR